MTQSAFIWNSLPLGNFTVDFTSSKVITNFNGSYICIGKTSTTISSNILYVSLNYGSTWRQINLTNVSRIYAFAMDYFGANTFIVVLKTDYSIDIIKAQNLFSADVFVTIDVPLIGDGDKPTQVACDNNGIYVYVSFVGTIGTILRYNTTQDVWTTSIINGVNVTSINSITCSTNGKYVYAGCQGGIFLYSNDYGVNFYSLQAGDLTSVLNSIAIDINNNIYIADASKNDVIYIVNNNDTYIVTDHIIPDISITSVGFIFADSTNNLYITTINNNFRYVYVSIDNGASWTKSEQGLPVSSFFYNITGDIFSQSLYLLTSSGFYTSKKINTLTITPPYANCYITFNVTPLPIPSSPNLFVILNNSTYGTKTFLLNNNTALQNNSELEDQLFDVYISSVADVIQYPKLNTITFNSNSIVIHPNNVNIISYNILDTTNITWSLPPEFTYIDEVFKIYYIDSPNDKLLVSGVPINNPFIFDVYTTDPNTTETLKIKSSWSNYGTIQMVINFIWAIITSSANYNVLDTIPITITLQGTNILNYYGNDTLSVNFTYETTVTNEITIKNDINPTETDCSFSFYPYKSSIQNIQNFFDQYNSIVLHSNNLSILSDIVSTNTININSDWADLTELNETYTNIDSIDITLTFKSLSSSYFTDIDIIYVYLYKYDGTRFLNDPIATFNKDNLKTSNNRFYYSFSWNLYEISTITNYYSTSFYIKISSYYYNNTVSPSNTRKTLKDIDSNNFTISEFTPTINTIDDIFIIQTLKLTYINLPTTISSDATLYIDLYKDDLFVTNLQTLYTFKTQDLIDFFWEPYKFGRYDGEYLIKIRTSYSNIATSNLFNINPKCLTITMNLNYGILTNLPIEWNVIPVTPTTYVFLSESFKMFLDGILFATANPTIYNWVPYYTSSTLSGNYTLRIEDAIYYVFGESIINIINSSQADYGLIENKKLGIAPCSSISLTPALSRANTNTICIPIKKNNVPTTTIKIGGRTFLVPCGVVKYLPELKSLLNNMTLREALLFLIQKYNIEVPTKAIENKKRYTYATSDAKINFPILQYNSSFRLGNLSIGINIITNPQFSEKIGDSQVLGVCNDDTKTFSYLYTDMLKNATYWLSTLPTFKEGSYTYCIIRPINGSIKKTISGSIVLLQNQLIFTPIILKPLLFFYEPYLLNTDITILYTNPNVSTILTFIQQKYFKDSLINSA